MKPRPLSVTLAGWLFVLVGVAGVIDALLPLFHAGGVQQLHSDPIALRDLSIVLSLRLIAAVGGVFVLKGSDWARWLLAGWMLYHLSLSLEHSWIEGLLHAVVFSVVVYALFMPGSSRFFGHGVRG